MKKISTISLANVQSVDILSSSQMSSIRGGTAFEIVPNVMGNVDTSGIVDASALSVGPISATEDEKRRSRPGGGVSTH